jgi:Lrp/AsnC family transcriptional regulator, leucine-responsive regulatory protein
MDETDFQILNLLQENARTPVAEIARSVGLGASAIHQRIRKLEETGVIQGYEARLDPHALGRNLVSFVRVQTGEGAQAEEITSRLVALPEVQEVHRVVGEDCFFVKVRVRDTRDLADLLDHRIRPIPNIASTKTTIVLTTAKETRAVPLARGPEGGGPAGNPPPSRNGGESGTPGKNTETTL